MTDEVLCDRGHDYPWNFCPRCIRLRCPDLDGLLRRDDLPRRRRAARLDPDRVIKVRRSTDD